MLDELFIVDLRSPAISIFSSKCASGVGREENSEELTQTATESTISGTSATIRKTALNCSRMGILIVAAARSL